MKALSSTSTSCAGLNVLRFCLIACGTIRIKIVQHSMLERAQKVLSSISEAVDLKKLFAPSTIAVVHWFDEL